MKKIIVLFIIVSLPGCTGQSKISNNKKKSEIKQQKMEYFDIDKYKDWEVDNNYTSKETRKFLKKGNERIRISFRESTIQVEATNIQNPYSWTKVYYPNNKSLKAIIYEFYTINIGIYKMYDQEGKLIEEINYENPFKFSLKDAIGKVKKEYGFDLEDLTQRCVLERFESVELDQKPLYAVYLKNNEDANIMDYIVIDGTTGETLFKSYMAINGEREIPPYYRYIESLKKAEQENNAYYKTYKGKDYTKKEWEVFEEEWYKNYKENKDKGFWDDIFKRP